MKNEKLTIVSPTYTYYQKYGDNLYHFDLYRATAIEDIMRIGADEILEDTSTICIIEWPDIVQNIIQPTKMITINIRDKKRYFEIQDVKAEGLT